MKKSGFKNKYSPMKKFRPIEGDNILQVSEADRKFSLYIRQRDGRCVVCGSSLFLGCSHYYGRGIYATRYDPDNCITLCQECHEVWEHEKGGVYWNYMFAWLGPQRLEALKTRSETRISPYQAIESFMELTAKLQSNDIEY